ncbi:MalY/PatB family protein [Aminipila luticellarii]|uniref:cysteine-S-conjugate beta-lyase n=1 Tax=Aminipila luticellarii TaxID=2507160 RepID=A0A410PVF6_9FIRM|nr:PatB family C-S lyase [Aminipila luticellarii]QAT42929.1 putative C-S lyase [Aminipila luticellarii]
MKYNFDEIIDRRNTNSQNVEGFRSYLFNEYPDIEFPFADDEFIRMWVADMEFATPPEICDAIKKRVDQRIFGYTKIYDPGYYNALNDWCKRLYDWSFPKEELVFSPGIIPALYGLVKETVAADEKMLITTPAYGFFKHAADFNNRELVCSDLKYEKGYFTVDFDDFEKKAADPKVKMVLWCNPHNPTGRMWTEEELGKVAAIIETYDLWVISDEIHCDLIRQGKKHIPLGKVMPEYKKLVTCMAASKTFNMAGMNFSNIIIRDSALRRAFRRNSSAGGDINPLSLTANQTAYEKGADWLEQLKDYLDGNFNYCAEFFKQNVPEAVCCVPEATYLAWVDLNACLPDIENLPLFFAQKAGVLLEGGDALFVNNAKGFVRLNLAMPRALLKEGLKRIAHAIHEQNQNK